jgi:uncharacterized protein YjbI with pentapeptide repeats
MNEKVSPPEPRSADEQPRTGRSGVLKSQPVILFVLMAALAIVTANVWILVRLMERQTGLTREHFFWVLCQPGHSTVERLSAFQHLVADGNREWRSAQLSDLYLASTSLPGADLQQAGFQRANLSRANLAAAKMTKASLNLSDLTEAEMAEADLSEAQCYRAVLKGTKLRRAILRAAMLQEVKAENADLTAADLSDADCLMANFTDANLSGANLTGARLEGAILKGVNFSLARLDGANLKDADFTDSNWWHARGLTTAQAELLRKNFAPSQAAAAGLKADYQKWAGGSGK